MFSRLALCALLLPTAALSLDRLPTGVRLDPVVAGAPLGNMPLAMALAPDHRHVAVLMCGYREQGLQIVDRTTGKVTQTLAQPAAFLGIAFAPDGKTLWTSGGNDDSLDRYTWSEGKATLDRRIELRAKANPKDGGTSYPAGIAFSRDGRFLYAAENLADTVAVVDTSSGEVVQHVQTDRYPYAIAVAPDGNVWVSSWGDNTVLRFRPGRSGFLTRTARVEVGRHPSAILVTNNRLFAVSASTDSIAIVDTKTLRVTGRISDPPPHGVREGSTPNALALSGDRLYVAEGDNNAVAVVSVTAGKLLGRVPVEWYPAALAFDGGDLLVLNAKGRGTAPNPQRPQPGKGPNGPQYTLSQIHGTLATLQPSWSAAALQRLSARVARANGWNARAAAAKYPPFRHVIYVIKENRTYDQIFGDVNAADGDPSLLFFGRDVTPNHHALAERFGIFDRFFVNAEVSADGHNWSTAAYVTDYTTKTVPSEYSSRGRSYDYEGTNRRQIVDDDDDAAAPSAGYLWDLAARKGITYRDYGEFTAAAGELLNTVDTRNHLTRRALVGHTDIDFPGFDLTISDQKRIDLWLDEFRKLDELPALEIIRLPNDHTDGAKANAPTPRAYMADNDLALGRLIDALSHSRWWRDTAVFVLEDDAQNGPDHVDSHRSVLLVLSAYNKPGVVHRFVNTTDVLATMEEILGLDSLSQFDRFSRPLGDVFTSTPDLRPYDVLTPAVSLDEKNPPDTKAAKQSAQLDFSAPDRADDDTLNRILWTTIKGDVPYPAATRAPAEGTR
jgi:DNA-binding beta-propeller fold protein YncE